MIINNNKYQHFQAIFFLENELGVIWYKSNDSQSIEPVNVSIQLFYE